MSQYYDRHAVCMGKQHFGTADLAWTFLRHTQKRRKREQATRSRKANRDSPGKVTPYRCGCGQGWVLGHHDSRL